jgi:serine protease DegQ
VGKVVGTDPETDLAVVRVSAPGLTPVTFGQSEQARVGDVVLAIGDPFSVGQTVTMGIISAVGREIGSANPFGSFIQTDAAINPGNSGGPWSIPAATSSASTRSSSRARAATRASASRSR